MRRLSFPSAILCLAICLFALGALASPPSSISYQGRLTNPGGTPVSGAFQVTFRLYESPLGGAPLASETRTVDAANGLFASHLDTLGNPDLYRGHGGGGGGGGATNLYLGISVGADPELTPRTSIVPTPFAQIATGLDGDVVTGPGALSMSKLYQPGQPTYGNITFRTDPPSSAATFGDTTGHSLYSIFSSVDSATHELTFTDNGGGGVTLMKAKEKANRTKCANNLRCTNPALGADNEVSSEVDLTSAKHAINTKGAGSCSIESTCDQTSAKHAINTKGAGAQDRSIVSTCDDFSAKHAINTKGAGGNRILQVLASAYDDTASHQVTADLDGDGVPEVEVSSSASARTAVLKTKTKSNQSNDRTSVSLSSSLAAPDDGSSLSLQRDLNGDDLPETEVTSTVSSIAAITKTKTKSNQSNDRTSATTQSSVTGPDAGSSSVLEYDTDGDGVSDNSEETSVTAQRAKFTMKLGFNSSNRSLSELTCTADTIRDTADVRDGSGSSMSYSARGGKSGATKRCDVTSSGGSSSRSEAQDPDSTNDDQTFISSGSVKLHYTATKGKTGSTKREIYTGGPVTATSDEDCDDLASSMDRSYSFNGHTNSLSARCGASTSSVSVSRDGAVSSSMNSNGVGYLSSSLGVGVSSPTHPIEHSSGAHLTSGGVWTNASDKNLKENFTAVDGAEILEKVSELPVSRWNYKTESDQVTHIGPTAQDFKSTFGVGESDKTISTIDPSGVALVAIKELKKENDELRKELQELRQMVKKLKK